MRTKQRCADFGNFLPLCFTRFIVDFRGQKTVDISAHVVRLGMVCAVISSVIRRCFTFTQSCSQFHALMFVLRNKKNGLKFQQSTESDFCVVGSTLHKRTNSAYCRINILHLFVSPDSSAVLRANPMENSFIP